MIAERPTQRRSFTLSTASGGPLEDAGIVRRTDSRYYVIESEAMGRLLSAAGVVDVGAQRILAQRAQTAVEDAERLARELAAEL